MEINKLIKFIALIIVLCGIFIVLIFISPIPEQLRDGIIAEIVGGGILGAIVAYHFYNSQKTSWTFIFGAVALLFNPLIPVYLTKSIWVVIDLIAAILFFYATTILTRKAK